MDYRIVYLANGVKSVSLLAAPSAAAAVRQTAVRFGAAGETFELLSVRLATDRIRNITDDMDSCFS